MYIKLTVCPNKSFTEQANLVVMLFLVLLSRSADFESAQVTIFHDYYESLRRPSG